MNEHDRLGHASSDARKRLRELIALESAAAEAAEFGFDEQHAHLHEWPDYDDH